MSDDNEVNLTNRHQAKFEEICVHIEATGKAPDEAKHLANSLIDSTNEATHDGADPVLDHGLTKLVAEYQELSEQILEHLDEKHFGTDGLNRDLIEGD